MFFSGQIVSLMGTYIQNLALGWLIYRLTNSPFLLGAVGFAGQIPSLFLTPIAGVYADRLNRRRVLVGTQTLSMLMAFTLALLSLTGLIQIWQIILISAINGLALAFDTPFRHAFLIEMVGEKDLLQNAIALNSTLINSARFIGPTIGGFLIAWFGEGWCFFINGVSFMAVIASLLAMRVASRIVKRSKGSVLQELTEGIRYSFKNQAIRNLLLLISAIGFIGLPFQVFLPVFARDILRGDSQMLGFLTGALGAGALLGAFYLASRKGIKDLPKDILFASAIFSVGIFVFSLSNIPLISLAVIFFIGFGMIVQFAAVNTLLQHIVDEKMRGRVVALYGLSFMGITPIGSLLLGAISPSIGVQLTLSISGVLCVVALVLFARKSKIVKEAAIIAD
ncbi:MFS transporter [Tenuifilum thalassicum]|uniref:MFS transporter n=2 Tax=Tenuifilum thalassicum TaxID=2590900 RepID=A0A7D4CT16_9BACT|nr:MFS transporter [Tenuifilum thalassicum]